MIAMQDAEADFHLQSEQPGLGALSDSRQPGTVTFSSGEVIEEIQALVLTVTGATVQPQQPFLEVLLLSQHPS